MPSDSKFHRLPDAAARPVTIIYDGAKIAAQEGDTVAAALIAGGIATTRTTPVSGALRGPFCMMGVCFECLMEIDGEANRQACMVEVREGMAVRPMRGARAPAEGGDG